MRYFITGTDTDVGKTVVSAWLVQQLEADYWKPVQSGTNEGWDRDKIQKLTGIPDDRLHPESYALKASLSPHWAADLEDIEINLSQIQLPKTDRPLIVEGAGGVMVPLNNHQTMLDLIEKLALPVIVVARSGLGTINHTCLTLAALRHRSIEIAGVIMNGPLNEGNRQAIEHYGQVKVLGELGYLKPLTRESLGGWGCYSSVTE